MYHSVKIMIFITIVFAISSCGSGGGNSGSTPVITPPPPQNITFPVNFTADVQENTSGEYIRDTFKYNAPSDNPPTNLALTGPDAELFEVLIEATAADANGDRDVTVIIRRSSTSTVPFMNNFENPQDSDKDNVYQFSFSGTYEGRNISSNVRIAVQDVLDQAESAGRFYVGEIGTKGFGPIFASIPDVTGDGKAELGLLSEGIDAAESSRGFIISSDNMEGVAALVPVNDTTNHFVKFTDQVPQPDSRDNLISAQENLDSSVDIMISQGELNEATVFHIPQSERNGEFGGDKTLGIPNISSYVLDFTNLGSENQARLVDDINGDGKADIFIQGRGQTTQGFIFGTDGVLNSKVTADFDIELQQPSDFGTNNLEPLNIRKVPDLNGDGIDDFLIVRVKRITFLSGMALRDATLTTLDLENLTSQQGFSISDVSTFFRLADVIATTDFDGDGFPTLMFITKEAGGGGASLPVIDGDDFMALSTNPVNEDFENALRSVAPNSGTYQEGILLLGDRTGDGIDDILVFNGSFGSDIELISGAVIQDALNSTAPSNQVFKVPDGDTFKIEIERFDENTNTTTAQPVWFQQMDLIAFGSVCATNPNNVPCAGVGLLQASDIDSALASSAPGLLFRSPNGLPF